MTESPLELSAKTPETSQNSENSRQSFGTQTSPVILLTPADPERQEKRLPIRILKMLTAHTAHLLHPEYLQPLSSAPVTIELDAKKSPLALLAQTCSQIGKPDPSPSTKLSSISASSLSDKDGRSTSSSSLKSGEQPQTLEDKSSFKPYSKPGGDARKDGAGVNGAVDKAVFRTSAGPGPATCTSFSPRVASPRTVSPLQNTPGQVHSNRQAPLSPSAQKAPNASTPVMDIKPPGSNDPSNRDHGNNICGGKKDMDHKSGQDNAQLANSSHVRASTNSSNASSASSPQPDSKSDTLQPPQTGLNSAHIAPISPFKTGHSGFPLPPSSLGYHASIAGAYAGYPSQFVPGLDPSKSGLVGAGMGVPGKHPSSSPLSGASPPSFMQGLCRDPYCLSYPNAPHLGGGNCTSCVPDPSSTLHKSGLSLMYPSHHLHSLHPSALSSNASPAMSHPLYTYGFVLPNDPLPHACNWVSAGGPCDKRFTTSEELLAHLRTHTALHGIDGKLLAGYPSSAASCHLHLPPHSSPGALPSSFALRGSPALGLARYHPYGKAHLPGAPSLPIPSLSPASPYYSPYALYSQRLGSASALGYP